MSVTISNMNHLVVDRDILSVLLSLSPGLSMPALNALVILAILTVHLYSNVSDRKWTIKHSVVAVLFTELDEILTRSFV